MKRILELVGKYEINLNNIYIESSDWQSLRVFRSTGFKTSYYFPDYDLKTIDADEKDKIRRQVQEIIKSGNVNAISFDVKYYKMIKSFSIPLDIELLTWDSAHTWYQLELMKHYKEISEDSCVKVILVKDYI